MAKISESVLIRPLYESLFKMIPNAVVEITSNPIYTAPWAVRDIALEMMQFITYVGDECRKIRYLPYGMSHFDDIKRNKYSVAKQQLKLSCETIADRILDTANEFSFNIEAYYDGIINSDNYILMGDSENYKRAQPLIEYAAINFYTSIEISKRDNKDLTIENIYKLIRKKYNKAVKCSFSEDRDEFIVNDDFILTDFNAELLWNLVNCNYERAKYNYNMNSFNNKYIIAELESKVENLRKDRDDIAIYIKENKVKSE